MAMVSNRAKLIGGLSAAVIAIATPFVASFEGEKLDPYLDVGGVLTVCFGETHNVENRKHTPNECRAMLADSLAKHGRDIGACMPVGLPDNVQAAMLSFGYNAGAANFCGSTMARKLMNGDIPGACAELDRWVFVAGKDCRLAGSNCRGIVERRKVERAICEGRS